VGEKRGHKTHDEKLLAATNVRTRWSDGAMHDFTSFHFFHVPTGSNRFDSRSLCFCAYWLALCAVILRGKTLFS
jgi:hypothetical protein